jgi:UDP-N-acetylmuramoyl-tripeptide--D-alanyl-D-alanine ligase
MQDLGNFAEALHRQVGAHIKGGQIDYLFTFGPQSVYTAEEARTAMGQERVFSAQDKQELLARLEAVLDPAAIVLIKGSREMRLEEIAEALLQKAEVS